MVFAWLTIIIVALIKTGIREVLLKIKKVLIYKRNQSIDELPTFFFYYIETLHLLIENIITKLNETPIKMMQTGSSSMPNCRPCKIFSLPLRQKTGPGYERKFFTKFVFIVWQITSKICLFILILWPFKNSFFN